VRFLRILAQVNLKQETYTPSSLRTQTTNGGKAKTIFRLCSIS
jgi:hypothetical protein